MEIWQPNDVANAYVLADSHTIEVFASEGSRYPIEDKIEIPQGYGINEVVVLPVSKEAIFIYWEITEDFLMQWQGQVGLSGGELILVAFELSQGQARHITTFALEARLGKRYIRCRAGFNPTVALIGAFKAGTFYDMLVSRTIHYPGYRFEGISIELISEFCLSRSRPESPYRGASGQWECTFSGTHTQRRS
uniref:DUF4912 domain-containing protein n=1 Tax=uncultured Nitrospirae bacterium MY2-3C TaxID=798577 RepID=D9MP02_9BACT|nr:hypothetical protein LW2_0160 [uncultured Nitrospirae bacterium MY2-3C]